MVKNTFRVAIFGSARIKKNDPKYRQIESLAQRIAKAGFDVVTGGGPGIMEAANKGHKEGRKNNDVHSFGLNIELPYEQISNKHLDVKKEFKEFSKRLSYFMKLSNAVVVAPGGIGTLLELFYTLQLMQVGHIKNMPIIFIGDMWSGLVNWIEEYPLKKRLLNKHDLHPLFLAKHNTEAMKILKKAHIAYINNDDGFCDSYRKYKIDADL